MKISPITVGFFYLCTGGLFTYLAILSVRDTIWNFLTIVLMLLAAYDVMLAFRMFTFKRRIDKLSKK